MKRLLPALILGGLLSQGLSAQVAQVENTRAKPADWEEINFEFGQAVIVDGFPSLLRLADLLKSHPDYKVNIVGNTDQIGSNRANDALSLRRADAVAQFLQKYGANPNQIMTKGDGKRNLEENATNRNARFINRRVVITVTAPDGTVIGDGSIGSAIEDFITYARGQLSKIDGILAQLQTLEAQVRALNTSEIKADTGAIRQDTQAIRQDTGAIRQDTGTLVQRPVPLTSDQTTTIAKTAAQEAADYALTQSAIRNRKYALVGFDIGPTFAHGRTGNFSTDLFGKGLIPFGNGQTDDKPGTHGVQIDGDWTYYHKRGDFRDGLNDGIFNIGLVNRFNHIQLGTFAQFDYASFNAYQGGGLLGAGVLTIDFVFKSGSFGVFGAKGFRGYTNVGTTATRPLLSTPIPAYLRYDDQFGFHALGSMGKMDLEASIAIKKRYQSGAAMVPAAMVKLTFPMSDQLDMFIEADQNTTFQNTFTGDRVVFGIQFGNWLRPKNYGSTTGVVPVEVPRPHYELLAR